MVETLDQETNRDPPQDSGGGAGHEISQETGNRYLNVLFSVHNPADGVNCPVVKLEKGLGYEEMERVATGV